MPNVRQHKIAALSGLLAVALLTSAAHAVRIKDIARVYGPMENPVVGYGLVVGLAGSGDTAKFQPAVKLISNMLSRLGEGTLPAEVIGSKNCAVVMVQATLPAFAKPGDRLDVEISAVGNAKSLDGGRLVLCPLSAAGAVFAIAQGTPKVNAAKPTAATIESGAIVQRRVPVDLTPGDKVTFILDDAKADSSIATRIVNAIHQDLLIEPAAGDAIVARAVDPATVEVMLTPEQLANPVPFISRLERLTVPGINYDMEARVVIDETNGSFYAINGNVEISPVIVEHNGFLVEVKPAQGEDTSTLDDLVTALRELDAPAADVIGLLKSLEEVGALHAKVISK